MLYRRGHIPRGLTAFWQEMYAHMSCFGRVLREPERIAAGFSADRPGWSPGGRLSPGMPVGSRPVRYFPGLRRGGYHGNRRHPGYSLLRARTQFWWVRCTATMAHGSSWVHRGHRLGKPTTGRVHLTRTARSGPCRRMVGGASSGGKKPPSARSCSTPPGRKGRSRESPR